MAEAGVHCKFQRSLSPSGGWVSMAGLIFVTAFKPISRQTIRRFAHVAPGILNPLLKSEPGGQQAVSKLDKFLLSTLETSNVRSNRTASLVEQYHDNRGRELKLDLVQPESIRRLNVDPDTCPIYLVVHAAQNGSQSKVCFSSGFKLEVRGGQEPTILTCAHTLEEIHFSSILDSPATISNTFILRDDGTRHLVKGIPSSMPRHDLLLVSPEEELPLQMDGAFPVSFYPAQVGTKIAAHFIVDYRPELEAEGWVPCFNGFLLRKWVHGEIVGYRDFAGNEAKPGTYDSLAHMFFSAIPTPGSSGGPVIDLESGSIIGVIRGSRLDNQVVGLRGWATSCESIYEMFRLPGIASRDLR